MSNLSSLQKVINKLVLKRAFATDQTVKAALTEQIRKLESVRADLLTDKATKQ